MKYPIHGTILRIVSNLLTTKFFGGFLIRKTNRSLKMKSKILIAGAMLCAITTTGAHAVTKCVALKSSGTTCTSNYYSYQNKTDWAATCTTNGVSTSISGIGICSSTDGGPMGATATELDRSSTADKNMHCWCKMTSPAVSRWVFYYSSGASASYCGRYCAYYCAAGVQTNADFRSALFGSLSD